MRYIIADLVFEINSKFGLFKKLASSFEYFGERDTDIVLDVSDLYIENIHKRMVMGSSIEQAEVFALSCCFNREITKFNALLIHSSAIIYKGNAYLFAAESGVGKSTHTRLWNTAFGDDISYINDDKYVIRCFDGGCFAFGTPFDGGSKIANNVSAPLKAIVFLSRGESNSICRADNMDIVKNLYFHTALHFGKKQAEDVLDCIDTLIKNVDFYNLCCNTDISAALLAEKTIT